MQQVKIRIKQKSLLQVQEWIDCEVADTYFTNFQKENDLDLLLELRRIITEGRSNNQVVFGFYRLLSRLDRSYYLLGYRIRQWVSLNFIVRAVDPMGVVDSMDYSISSHFRDTSLFRKQYLEDCEYAIAYHDVRLELIEK